MKKQREAQIGIADFVTPRNIKEAAFLVASFWEKPENIKAFEEFEQKQRKTQCA